MGIRVLYHGSKFVVEKPCFNSPLANPHNDYGRGFYCTGNIEMAKEWANIATEHGYVNKYEIDERGLIVLDLTDKAHFDVLDWLSVLLHHRSLSPRFAEIHEQELRYLEERYLRIGIESADVMIGYRADDAYFRFPLMFLDNVLTYERLEEIYHNGELGKQYALKSEKAFQKIRYLRSFEVEPIYHQRYMSCKDAANRSYSRLELEERNAKGTRIRDLMEGRYD